MEVNKIVGLEIKDDWSYEFISAFIERPEKIKNLININGLKNNVAIDKTCRFFRDYCSDGIYGTIEEKNDGITKEVLVDISVNSLNYLKLDNIQIILDTASEGILEGLERTLERMKEVKAGNADFDTGHVDYDEVLTEVRMALDNNDAIKLKNDEKNHLAIYFAELYFVSKNC